MPPAAGILARAVAGMLPCILVEKLLRPVMPEGDPTIVAATLKDVGCNSVPMAVEAPILAPNPLDADPTVILSEAISATVDDGFPAITR
jgi:hypothetical protein